MNNYGIGALVVLFITMLTLPRRWAFLPLIVGACYVTQGQNVELGPFTFSFLRLLEMAGLIRIIARREWLPGGLRAMDKLVIAWALWAVLSSAFHNNPAADLVGKLGLTYDVGMLYFLTRVFSVSEEGVRTLGRSLIWVLIPVAVLMVHEVRTLHNVFSVFGGVNERPNIRGGRVRASGPFRHPILAGTVGAVSMPMSLFLFSSQPALSMAGFGAGATMVYTSGSSGPVMTAAAALIGTLAWRLRYQMVAVRWVIVIAYLLLEAVMEPPAYFIIARLDVTGSSTGYHRAALIRSAFNHLDEWWLAGTDYTRHWMPTGVPHSPDHTDITNQYLSMGVQGGLPLMLLFIALFYKGFSEIGKSLKRIDRNENAKAFPLWILGCSLFAHVVTFVSVSYYDQSRIFIYVLLGLIATTTELTQSMKAVGERVPVERLDQSVQPTNGGAEFFLGGTTRGPGRVWLE